MEKEETVTPEFEKALNAMKEQLDFLSKVSLDISQKICVIEPFDTKASKEVEIAKQKPEGILEDILICVNRLKEYNADLGDSANELTRLVG